MQANLRTTRKARESLEKLVFEKAQTPGRHHIGAGLYLQVGRKGAPGARSWLLRYTLDKRAREMGLGRFDALDVHGAMARALEHRRLLDKPKSLRSDPLEARKKAVADAKAEDTARKLAEAKDKPFTAVTDEFLAEHLPTLKSSRCRRRYELQVKKHVTSTLGDTAISQVNRAMVLDALDGLRKERKRATAIKVMGEIRLILDYAERKEYRPAGSNVAAWDKPVQRMFPKRLRADVDGDENYQSLFPDIDLSIEDIPKCIARLRQLPDITALALEWTILAAARPGMTLGATWPEINADRRVWTVGGQRMKAGKRFRVPITDRMAEILEAVRPFRNRDTGDKIFPGDSKNNPGGMSDGTMRKRLQVTLGYAGATPHGTARATFSSWRQSKMAMRFPTELAEAALAHLERDDVMRAYGRSDALEPRRELMLAWEEYLSVP